MAAAVLVAGFVFLTFVVLLRAQPPDTDPPAVHNFHTFSVDVPAGSRVARALVYRGSTAGEVVRGEIADSLVTDTPVNLANVAAVSVTVWADHASCAIYVDGTVADRAEAEGVVTCMWALPRQR